jgi:hypothetical protein
METETTLLLDLDERNLAHFLSALALAALAGRVEGNDRESRRCWWPEPGHFSIQTEHPCHEFRTLLFAKPMPSSKRWNGIPAWAAWSTA